MTGCGLCPAPDDVQQGGSNRRAKNREDFMLNTRRWIAIAGCAAALLAASIFGAPARADDYPHKLITLIVPNPPGGSADVSARIVANALSRKLGQSIVVLNKPGANGDIGYAST